MKLKYIAVLTVALAGFAGAPALGPAALGQVIVPHLAPPPCTGHHCLKHRRGAQTSPVDSAHRRPCPRGTVYNARRGTCKVWSNGMGH
jgi:hypothetical protein